MNAIFETVLKMSLTASVLALLVMLLRPFLKKAPKWIICALWALVALRLLLPFTIESAVSLMPDTSPMAQQVISLQSQEPVVSIRQTIGQENGQPVHIPTDIPEAPFRVRFWMVWVAGMGGMLLYLLYSYVSVAKRVRVFFEAEPGVRQCDAIDTPFIFGILRPKIYIPSLLPPEGVPFVVAHERSHLRRKDHLWKPLGFLLLTVHWFNPVLWVAYILLCRDIELACDERVIRSMPAEEKLAYSQILLQCSLRQRYVTACPLAFGEVGVKARVSSILHYKKPAFWIILVTLLAGIGLGVFFLTDRPEEENRQTAALEAVVETVLVGDRLEVQVLDTDYTGMLVISTKGLDLPVLTKGARILVTYDPADDLLDGYLEKVFDLAEIEEPPIGIIDRLEKHLEGTVQSIEGDTLQITTEAEPGKVYHINIRGFSLDLMRGDEVMVHYYPGEDSTVINQVQSINRTREADFDVDLQVSDVTPTGLTLQIRVDSDLPLTTTDNIWIDRINGRDFRRVETLPGGTFPEEVYTLSEGTFTVDWTSVYGALQPGQYAFYKPICYEERELIHRVDFVIP